MYILLTNDDGIYAQGLQALKKILSPIGEIYVVAPDRERSATGHGITVHSPIKAQEVSIEGANSAWSVDGTPVDCVKLGLESLMPCIPDLLVSGINWGPNLGTDVLYSGTVSAAIEGVINNIPSIAISLATREDPNFYTSTKHIQKIIQEISNKKLPSDCLCNVNIPNISTIRGTKITTLCRRKYENVFHKRLDPRGQPYYWMGGEPKDEELSNNSDFITDACAVKENYISITPVHFDLTDYNSIKLFSTWFEKK
ncbi:MAG: 5'/3'-nucleotidase SurE [Clostridiales bacterium]|nr:5'/3'-nucleotidase SurE [Clostridiales bacterium]MCF8021986.1 5'/3'-nucleotidase SurE [Clostridiales bacterium]